MQTRWRSHRLSKSGYEWLHDGVISVVGFGALLVVSGLITVWKKPAEAIVASSSDRRLSREPRWTLST